MHPRSIAPAPRLSLADVVHDIAGDLPREILLEWNASDRSPAVHDALLAPYLVRGTIVSSDSAGLSSLTQRLPLAAVLKLVAEPKEILHALARAIGGEAIGVWTADNTQLFFDERIAPERVIDQLFEAQRRVASRTVQIGIGAHVAECYRIAGGLYGPEADLIEHVAEELSRGGELLITPALYDRASPSQRAAARVVQDRAHLELYSITRFDRSSPFVDGNDTAYPAPFSPAFDALLRAHTASELAAMPLSDVRRTRTVVFIKAAIAPRTRLLDGFTELAIVDAIVRRTLDAQPRGATLVKSNGALAIALFEEDHAAIDFALAIEDELLANAPDARIALARGELFVFAMNDAALEVAGDPVNIASKLAEDSALSGVLVDRSVSIATRGALASSRVGERYSLSLGSLSLEGTRFLRR